MNEESRSRGAEDADLAALLAAAGPRTRPSSEAIAEVRAAVEAEWRATVAARRTRRRTMTWAAAAGVAAAAIGMWTVRPLLQPGQPVVATVARVVGDVQQDAGRGRWTPLAATDSLGTGTRLRSGPAGRVALRLEDGPELRLDSGSVIAFEDRNVARLSAGAVYVDSGAGPGAASPGFALETDAGSVRHVGTQYEARVLDGTLRVGVREGRVEIDSRGSRVRGQAGELLVLREGAVTRAPLASNAPEWDWVSRITPPFRIEGRSVDDFLAWAARETGRTIVYATPEAAQRSREVALRGTVEGLTPDEAVAAVLSTTSLRPSVEAGRIYVDATAH